MPFCVCEILNIFTSPSLFQEEMSKKLEELQKEKEEALLQRDHEWQEKMAGKVSYIMN